MSSIFYGREVLLTFNEHLSLALQQLRGSAETHEAHLVHIVKTIRNTIFKISSNFNGSVDLDSQNNAVPQTLLTLTQMLLESLFFDNTENY